MTAKTSIPRQYEPAVGLTPEIRAKLETYLINAVPVLRDMFPEEELSGLLDRISDPILLGIGTGDFPHDTVPGLLTWAYRAYAHQPEDKNQPKPKRDPNLPDYRKVDSQPLQESAYAGMGVDIMLGTLKKDKYVNSSKGRTPRETAHSGCHAQRGVRRGQTPREI